LSLYLNTPLSDKGENLCFGNPLGEPCEGGEDEVKRILEAIHSTTVCRAHSMGSVSRLRHVRRGSLEGVGIEKEFGVSEEEL
jgi:hypothetical protein